MSASAIDMHPPSYTASEEVVVLLPTAPSRNPRYNARQQLATDNSRTVIPAKQRIRALSEGKPGLPDGWKEWQHPEGDGYLFHLNKRVITSTDARSEQIQQLLEMALMLLMPKLGLGDLNPVEIYLNVLLDQGGPPFTVEYYLVDHQARQIFWLDNVCATTIGIASFPSTGYLKSVLTPEYWTHVDYFPMHMREEYLRPAEEELLLMLSHGRLDVMTSPGSTCPYSAEECSQYIDIVERNKRYNDVNVIGYRTACVARLWNAMARARHINNYGLDAPRLDRLQGLPDYRESSHVPSLKLSIAEMLTFFAPVPIWERLVVLFNGRVVYQRHWAIFFNDIRRNWLLMGTLAAGTLACDVLLLSNNIATAFTAASASFATASVFTAVYLHHLHPEYQLGTGPEISQYVMKYEDYYHGLRPLSIALALPQALTIYAIIALLCAIVSSTIEHARSMEQVVAMVVALSLGALPVLLSSSFLSAGNNQGPSIWSSISNIFSRKPQLGPPQGRD